MRAIIFTLLLLNTPLSFAQTCLSEPSHSTSLVKFCHAQEQIDLLKDKLAAHTWYNDRLGIQFLKRNTRAWLQVLNFASSPEEIFSDLEKIKNEAKNLKTDPSFPDYKKSELEQIYKDAAKLQSEFQDFDKQFAVSNTVLVLVLVLVYYVIENKRQHAVLDCSIGELKTYMIENLDDVFSRLNYLETSTDFSDPIACLQGKIDQQARMIDKLTGNQIYLQRILREEIEREQLRKKEIPFGMYQ